MDQGTQGPNDSSRNNGNDGNEHDGHNEHVDANHPTSLQAQGSGKLFGTPTLSVITIGPADADKSEGFKLIFRTLLKPIKPQMNLIFGQGPKNHRKKKSNKKMLL